MKIVTIRNNCNGYTVNDTYVVNKDYFNYYMTEGEFAENTPKDAMEQYEMFLEVEEWLKNGGSIEPEFTEEEIKLQEINNQIQEAKQYLTETGWIWEKYNRNVLVLKDMTSEEFNLKYSDIISKQEEYRVLINELEVQLGGK